MYRIRISLVCALMLCFAPPVSAEIYRWVDSAGRVHFGDQAPPGANRVQQLPDQHLPDTPDAVKMREVARKKPVTLYITDCGAPCDQATALLQARGIPYTTKYLDRDPEAAKTLKAMAGGQMHVPTLRIGDNLQKGFEKSLWNNLLDLAGYPAQKSAKTDTGK